jgi:outer membrane protein assembly factor BamB
LIALESGGDEMWSYDLPAPVRTTPMIGEDRILFGAYNGSFHAVSLEGFQGWRIDPSDLSRRISLSSPAVALDGTIYYGDHGGALRAVTYGGQPLWNFQTDDIVRAAPAIGEDGAIYFGSNDGVFYALNHDGSLRWSHETGGRIDSAAAIAPDGTIYFGSADGQLYALTAAGTLKWSVGVGKGLMVFVSPALAADGTIYVGTTGTSPLGTSQEQQEASYPFIAFNPEGEQVWEYQLAYWIRSSPTVVSDGTIYFGGWDGNLYALTPEGELRWQIALGDVPVEQGIEAQPVVALDGTIFVGTWDGRFVAVGEGD